MRTLFFIIPAMLFVTSAMAQEESSALAERMQRLERDLNFLQKQVYRGDTGAEAITATPSKSPVGYAELQEQVRHLRGEFERVQYEQRRISDEQKKLTADMDFRLRALEEQQRSMNSALTALAATAPTPPEAEATPADETAEPAAAEEKTESKPAVTGKDFPNSNEHYNHAFKLLNAKNYSAAATSFDEFVRTYPSDPLASNAYYWLGESYYVRSDFTRAIEAFRKGWEINPDGQKAPDNLYKLALSLANVKRTKEACVVLAQVISKYGDAAPRIREKAISERTTLQCK